MHYQVSRGENIYFSIYLLCNKQGYLESQVRFYILFIIYKKNYIFILLLDFEYPFRYLFFKCYLLLNIKY